MNAINDSIQKAKFYRALVQKFKQNDQVLTDYFGNKLLQLRKENNLTKFEITSTRDLTFQCQFCGSVNFVQKDKNRHRLLKLSPKQKTLEIKCHSCDKWIPTITVPSTKAVVASERQKRKKQKANEAFVKPTPITEVSTGGRTLSVLNSSLSRKKVKKDQSQKNLYYSDRNPVVVGSLNAARANPIPDLKNLIKVDTKPLNIEIIPKPDTKPLDIELIPKPDIDKVVAQLGGPEKFLADEESADEIPAPEVKVVEEKVVNQVNMGEILETFVAASKEENQPKQNESSEVQNEAESEKKDAPPAASLYSLFN